MYTKDFSLIHLCGPASTTGGNPAVSMKKPRPSAGRWKIFQLMATCVLQQEYYTVQISTQLSSTTSFWIPNNESEKSKNPQSKTGFELITNTPQLPTAPPPLKILLKLRNIYPNSMYAPGFHIKKKLWVTCTAH